MLSIKTNKPPYFSIENKKVYIIPIPKVKGKVIHFDNHNIFINFNL